ncbi:MAG: ATP-dependent Clp protease adaptor ClpS [Acidobacteriota bacterium]
MADGNASTFDGLDGELALERKKRTEKPKRYKVLLHNDDYTTTDFVVEVLMRYFHKQHAEATQIMLQVHHKGVGVAGVYPRDVAESKIQDVEAEARFMGMPLQLTLEAE